MPVKWIGETEVRTSTTLEKSFGAARRLRPPRFIPPAKTHGLGHAATKAVPDSPWRAPVIQSQRGNYLRPLVNHCLRCRPWHRRSHPTAMGPALYGFQP